ncbi:MAG: tRNA (N(6)-L-threonylcarbamoyladenosine(37)-C(2))-methylthiotransferase MtaB [Proteobacteria bacterium]|nr:tRNA (N(6)-L-threonylcarbamoyladenosine(37)-C(2))-methylthiotransferase MtaB [Pseudomonadota bacterium]
MKKASFFTLGCRLNHTESSIIAKNIENHGFVVSQKNEGADLCIINTCTVTNQSDAKCRQAIRSIQQKNPDALIAVIGCFSQVASQQILDIGGVDIILGNEEKLNLHKYLDHFTNSSDPVINVEKISKEPFLIDTFALPLGATRANLKIQDGCNFICSFCIIPFARGRSRSRELDNIKDETHDLVSKGVKEIILTGVNIGTYQFQEANLMTLLEELDRIDGLERIRISSIEPTTIGDEFLHLMADTNNKLVPYLHLPLQSANNSVLQLMRRKYSIDEYTDLINRAVETVPDLCIGSDIMTGFPGETEDIFEDTLATLKNLVINYFHVFPYAERKGTQSAKLPFQVYSETIKRRAAVLRELSQQKKEQFIKTFIGKELRVLFENNRGGTEWSGYTENYIRVSVSSTEELSNTIKSVKIRSQESGQAMGEIVK